MKMRIKTEELKWPERSILHSAANSSKYYADYASETPKNPNRIHVIGGHVIWRSMSCSLQNSRLSSPFVIKNSSIALSRMADPARPSVFVSIPVMRGVA